MKTRTLQLSLIGATLLTLGTIASPARADNNSIDRGGWRQDHREIRQDKREIHRDRAELRRDVRDARHDHRHVYAGWQVPLSIHWYAGDRW